MGEIYERLATGFQPFDWWLIIIISLVAALIMRRWTQLAGAAAIAFAVDAVVPFFYRVATGVPADLAYAIALVRVDERGGLVVLLRLALYLAVIAVLFAIKVRYGRR
ncbi:MAG: hypothetical protein KIS81_00065 [Maricaulaceae bacterium]|nr:hypothetical protein [Maricaulaceae bacterium]